MALGKIGGLSDLSSGTRGHQLACNTRDWAVGQREAGHLGCWPCMAGKEWHLQESGIAHSGRFLGKDGAWVYVRRKS